VGSAETIEAADIVIPGSPAEAFMSTKGPKTKSEPPHASMAPEGEVDADANAKTPGDPLPQEENAETVVGRNLAELIGEIHDEHRQFTDSSSIPDTRDPVEPRTP
jgi:hypothetical protein